MDEASKLANGERHDEAIALCEQVMRLRGPSSAAYYLMGVIQQPAGKRTKAEGVSKRRFILTPGMMKPCLPWP